MLLESATVLQDSKVEVVREESVRSHVLTKGNVFRKTLVNAELDGTEPAVSSASVLSRVSMVESVEE